MPAVIHYIQPHKPGVSLCQEHGAPAPIKSDMLSRSPAKVSCEECSRILTEAAAVVIESHRVPGRP